LIDDSGQGPPESPVHQDGFIR
jgi:hypothetical protein